MAEEGEMLDFRIGGEKFAHADPKSIIAMYRRRLLGTLFDNLYSKYPRPKVLVVDSITARNIRDTVSMFELCRAGIVLIENIAMSRKPYPDLEVVYLVHISSFQKALKDFDEPVSGPQSSSRSSSSSSSSTEVSVKEEPTTYMYKAIHLFLASGFNKSQITDIRNHPEFARRCLTFADASIDFIVEEAYVAHLASPEYFPSLFPGARADTSVVMSKYRHQLTSFLVAMNLDPTIHYQEGFPRTQLFAQDLKSDIEAARRNTNFTEGEPSKLIILDRLSDIASVLLFEYSYQGRVIDVFERGHPKHMKAAQEQGKKVTQTQLDRTVRIEDPDNPSSSSSSSSSDKEDDRKELILNDEDPFWVRYRHTFVRIPLEQHKTELERLKQNPDFQDIINKQEGHVKGTMIHNLTEYTTANSKLSAHSRLLQLMKNHSATHLTDRIATTQQNILAAAYTKEGGDYLKGTDALRDVTYFSSNSAPRLYDRLRLLITYIMCKEMSSKDTHDLFEAFHLGDESLKIIEALEYLKIIPSDKTRKGFHFPEKRRVYGQWLHEQLELDQLFDLDQYKPLIYDIIQSYITGGLSESSYPSIAGSGASVPEPRRGARRSWDASAPVAGSQPLIIFVLGGVTAAEARVYEEMKKEDSGMPPVYLVGSEFITPYSFFSYMDTFDPSMVSE